MLRSLVQSRMSSRWILSVASAATIASAASRTLHLVVIVASSASPYGRIEPGMPFVPIRVRLIKVLEVPVRDAQSEAARAVRTKRFLPPVPRRPAGAIYVVRIQHKLIPPLTGLPRRGGDRPWPVGSFDGYAVLIAAQCDGAAELPIHRILRVVPIAAVQNTVDGVIALLEVERACAIGQLQPESALIQRADVVVFAKFPVGTGRHAARDGVAEVLGVGVQRIGTCVASRSSLLVALQTVFRRSPAVQCPGLRPARLARRR